MKDLFIFTHIPKTAGGTMYKLLNNIFELDEILLCFFKGDENLPGMSAREKNKLKLLRGHVPYGLHQHFPDRNTRYFTMLREPIDRIISLYYYVKGKETHEWHEKAIKFNMLEFCEEFKDETSNLQSFYLTKNRNPSFDEVKQAIINNFEFAGITDLFNESVMLMKFIFAWNDCSYRIVNRTKKRRSIDELSEKELEYLTAQNQVDIQVYDWLRNRVQQEYIQLLSKPVIIT